MNSRRDASQSNGCLPKAARKFAKHGKTPAWRTATMLVISFALTAAAFAQTSKKSKDARDTDSAEQVSPVPVSDGQAVDTAVGQMLGAWQVGDVDLMHKFIADDVVTVSGNWEPPLIGWPVYLKAYQEQRARSQGRLERTNTLSKVSGNTAWVTYQWEYTGQVDGNVMDAVGHTTLLLEKRSGNWVIVLNHTSTVPLPARSSAAPAASSNITP